MKTRIKSVLLSVLTITALPGCSNMQQYPLYNLWQERAYGAYGMQTPQVSQTPASPFMTTALRPAPIPAAEQLYIAQYYSLQ
jgi:hypothetical protein